jgi:hypothetical protein
VLLVPAVSLSKLQELPATLEIPPSLQHTRDDMRCEPVPSPGAPGGSRKKSTGAPAKVVAGHIMSKIGRPNRSRRIVVLSLLLAIVMFVLLLGRQHAVSTPSSCDLRTLTDCWAG